MPSREIEMEKEVWETKAGSKILYFTYPIWIFCLTLTIIFALFDLHCVNLCSFPIVQGMFSM